LDQQQCSRAAAHSHTAPTPKLHITQSRMRSKHVDSVLRQCALPPVAAPASHPWQPYIHDVHLPANPPSLLGVYQRSACTRSTQLTKNGMGTSRGLKMGCGVKVLAKAPCTNVVFLKFYPRQSNPLPLCPPQLPGSFYAPALLRGSRSALKIPGSEAICFLPPKPPPPPPATPHRTLCPGPPSSSLGVFMLRLCCVTHWQLARRLFALRGTTQPLGQVRERVPWAWMSSSPPASPGARLGAGETSAPP
jgi:hypothetical protein